MHRDLCNSSVHMYVILNVYVHVCICRYYPEIYNLSGTASLADKYGDWFTWNGSPRAKIFARNTTHVTDLQSMIALMRCVVCEYMVCCVNTYMYSKCECACMYIVYM